MSHSRSKLAVIALLVGGQICATGCDSKPPQTRPAPGREVTVAAAADLRFALEEIIRAFSTENADVTIRPTYGSSGVLRTQLLNKAPFDIYLSADISYPQELARAGIVGPQEVFSYGVGRIVLWAPKQAGLNLQARGIAAITPSSVRKIAIANPQHAPYGRAAEAALKQLGVYEQISARLVLADNIAQAAQFVESGGANVGVLALSLAWAPALKEQGDYWEFPLDSYPKMEQGGVILPWAKDAEAAQRFRAFLLGESGQRILERYGFFRANR